MFKGLTKFNTPVPEAQIPKVYGGNESFYTMDDDFTGTEYPSPDDAPREAPQFDTKGKTEYCPVRLKQSDENGNNHYECFITSTIIDIEEYFNLLEVLGLMRNGDTIEIFISSPGGLISTGSAISALIVECQGKVITTATGICASAGSLIWSAGHECKVKPTAVLMWHMSSHFGSGNSKAIQIEAARMVDHVRTVFLSASVEKGHITEEEMDTICKEPNREVFISAKQMQERLDAKSNPTEETSTEEQE
jgi:ATP-dependent protease ClpP protease subunit